MVKKAVEKPEKIYCDWGEHYVNLQDAIDLGQAIICKECEKSLSSQVKKMNLRVINMGSKKKKAKS